MKFTFKKAYKDQTDKELVELVIAVPHNEEAAAFLLYNRYDPLLHKIYRNFMRDNYWYDDCVDELFMHLRGRDANWDVLSSFEWRCTFGSWLTRVAKRKFQVLLPRLIENGGRNLSIDDEDPEKPKVQLPDGGDEDYERRQRKVMLLEAIGQLKNEEERFVVLKKLEGYNSEEIAIMIQKKWKKLGIVKYGYKKDKEGDDDSKRIKEIVVPDVSYVDGRVQRAKENLKTIMQEMV